MLQEINMEDSSSTSCHVSDQILDEVMRLYKEETWDIRNGGSKDVSSNGDKGMNIATCDSNEEMEAEESNVFQTSIVSSNNEQGINEKMGVVVDTSNESSALETISVSLSPDQLVEKLFAPGMKFRGRIRIPGIKDAEIVPAPDTTASSNYEEDDDTSTTEPRRYNDLAAAAAAPAETSSLDQGTSDSPQDDTYELIILKRDTDALGNPYILAHHKAYDDEQCVHIKYAINNGTISVEYEDGETVCKGRWNTIELRLEGNVCQRLHANDGAFHTRSAVTHIFTLHPCTYAFPLGRHHSTKVPESIKNNNGRCFDTDIVSIYTQAFATHRSRTYGSLMKTIQSLNDFVNSLGIGRMELLQIQKILSLYKNEEEFTFDGEEIIGMLLKLRHVNWLELFTGVTILSEQTSAELRRRAALLEVQHFETSKHRQDYFSRWKQDKMDLIGAHFIWSHCEKLGKNILRLAIAFDLAFFSKMGIYTLNVMRYRLESNYNCFESAYKTAERRMVTSCIRNYEISQNILTDGSTDLDMSCSICLYSLLSLDGVDEKKEVVIYKLPCSHCFHRKCVKQWLHNNSNCPVCRADLLSLVSIGGKKSSDSSSSR